jgi:siroheme synthase (precorrin-2 oxidase/ferrochelatase)
MAPARQISDGDAIVIWASSMEQLNKNIAWRCVLAQIFVTEVLTAVQ